MAGGLIWQLMLWITAIHPFTMHLIKRAKQRAFINGLFSFCKHFSKSDLHLKVLDSKDSDLSVTTILFLPAISSNDFESAKRLNLCAASLIMTQIQRKIG